MQFILHEMKLTVIRKIYSKKSIVGSLFINDVFFCSTLEDVSRDLNRDGDLNDPGEKKVPGKTAIPAGRYQLAITFSNRFQKLMPELIRVPGFLGIRIHSGNTADDTDGCLLVGNYDPNVPDFIRDSRLVYSKLMSKLSIAAKFEKITIEYIDLPADRIAA